ncbi:hypothetical protein AAC387_Pa05g0631 [Persea americana]
MLHWCVLGDFNTIILASEKLSFRPSRFVQEFQQMIISSRSQDMCFKGNKFTWSNNHKGKAYVAARLDRALYNSDWNYGYSDPVLTHLPKYSFDHCPLLLSYKARPALTNVPFKFEASGSSI